MPSRFKIFEAPHGASEPVFADEMECVVDDDGMSVTNARREYGVWCLAPTPGTVTLLVDGRPFMSASVAPGSSIMLRAPTLGRRFGCAFTPTRAGEVEIRHGFVD